MCVKLSFGDLNPDSFLPNPQKICIYRVTITLSVCGDITNLYFICIIYFLNFILNNLFFLRIKKFPKVIFITLFIYIYIYIYILIFLLILLFFFEVVHILLTIVVMHYIFLIFLVQLKFLSFKVLIQILFLLRKLL